MKVLKTFLLSLILVAGTEKVCADDWSEISAIDPVFAKADGAFVAAEVAKLKNAGLSGRPLYNKIREGLAKRVPHELLRRAIASERESYLRAVQLLDGRVTIAGEKRLAACKAIVIALRRGSKSQDISQAIARTPSEPVRMVRMIDLLGDLASTGIHGDPAVEAAGKMAGGNRIVPGFSGNDSRPNANRSILNRELRHNLPQNRPAQQVERH
jgi:hypothetical protein